MNLIELAPDTERWRALENAVMNLRVPQNVEKFLDQMRYRHLLKKASPAWSLISFN
jgi:hypothetical protein